MTDPQINYPFTVPPPGFHEREITNEAASLLPYIPGTHPFLGVEVGVAYAKTASILLHRRSLLRLILVDSWQQEHGQQVMGVALRNLLLFDPDRWRVIKEDSTVAAAEVQDASVDYVFIDASKVPEKYRADVLAWAPKVKPGGFIQGHDLHMLPEGFMQQMAAEQGWKMTTNLVRDSWMVNL